MFFPIKYGCQTVDLEHEMFQKKYLKITGACSRFGSFFVELLIHESTCMLNTLHAHIQTIHEKIYDDQRMLIMDIYFDRHRVNFGPSMTATNISL